MKMYAAVEVVGIKLNGLFDDIHQIGLKFASNE
jgi:hypothetical protein